MLSPDRPGTTFAPFNQLLQKDIAGPTGVPAPVAFKDFEGMNYAAWRSATIEAFRVFMEWRQWLVGDVCNPVWRMLMEEAFLRRRFGEIPNFYENISAYTNVTFIGPSRGQIEPVKENEADEIAVRNGWKTNTMCIVERGWDPDDVQAQIAEERKMDIYKVVEPVKPVPPASENVENNSDEDNEDE